MIPKLPRCGKCHSPAFKHDSWTCTGRPHFYCLSCKNDWTCGNNGGEYYDAAQTHPNTANILGWNEEDYKEHKLTIVGKRLLIRTIKPRKT